MGNIFHVTQRNCLSLESRISLFLYFFFLPYFSPSFPGSVKLVAWKFPVFLLLASRAGISGKGGRRVHHGMQTAPVPWGQWATPFTDGCYHDPLLSQKPSSLLLQFGSSRWSLKAFTKSLFKVELTPFPSPAGLCLKDLLCPLVFLYSDWSSSAVIPQRVFYFLSGQSSAW